MVKNCMNINKKIIIFIILFVLVKTNNIPQKYLQNIEGIILPL